MVNTVSDHDPNLGQFITRVLVPALVKRFLREADSDKSQPVAKDQKEVA